ncbi:DUF6919 domain-containing protein [Streptomyces sp. NPDC056255]|uniref:DUF6919 domain-containing protein n=1 Tax=Streptomyces sp. NPDC056255 TaxID=3345764 RepID=UPI0035E07D9B
MPTLPWMTRSDRRRWRSARTVADLGDLMALWLEGELGSRPGYQPRHGPDAETRPWTGVLPAANRAGYLTTGSQPGLSGQGADGKVWQQRAAVEGFIADRALLLTLIDEAQNAGIDVRLHSLPDTWGSNAITVTTRDGKPSTQFGTALSSDDLHFMWRGCAPEAVGAIAEACYVTVTDREYGLHTRLWEVLEKVVSRPAPVDHTAALLAPRPPRPAPPRASGSTEPRPLMAHELAGREECWRCGEPPVEGTHAWDDRGDFQLLSIHAFKCAAGHGWTNSTDGG